MKVRQEVDIIITMSECKHSNMYVQVCMCVCACVRALRTHAIATVISIFSLK